MAQPSPWDNLPPPPQQSASQSSSPSPWDNLPPPPQSSAQPLAPAGAPHSAMATLGGKLVEGADNVMGLAGDAEYGLGHYLIDPVVRAFGGHIPNQNTQGVVQNPPPQGGPLTPGQTGPRPDGDDTATIFPTGSQLQALTHRLGLTGMPSQEPQGGAERFAGALAGAAPFGPLSGLRALPAALTTAGSALGAQGMHEVAPSTGTAGELLGGLAGGTAGAFALAKLAGNGLERIASSLGDSTTYSDAGSYLQDAARRWLTTSAPAQHAAAWNAVPVAPTAPVTFTNYGNALQDITSRGGSTRPFLDNLTSRLPVQLRNDFNTASGGTPISGVRPPPATAPWSDAREGRSILGEAVADPTLVKDISAQDMAHLYQAYTQDLRDAALAHGGQAAQEAFDSANATSSRLYDIARGPMAKLIGGPQASLENDPTTGTAVQRLLSGGKKDGDTLNILRQQIPDAVDQLSAAHLRATAASPKTGWTKLSPEAQTALVPDAAQRANISAMVGRLQGNKNALLDQLKYTGGLLSGGEFAPFLFSRFLPGVDRETQRALGALGGLGAVAGAHVIGNAVHNPGALQLPALGAAIGAGNDLMDPPQQ